MSQNDDLRVHCPYGCQRASAGGDACDVVDERGYCRHLVGFTNDRRVYEPIEHVLTQAISEEGKPVVKDGKPVMVKSGRVRVLGGLRRKPIPKDAVLVNPVRIQKGDKGQIEHAAEWVSARVYMNGPAQQRQDNEPTAEMLANQIRLEALRAELADAEEKASEEDLRRKVADPRAMKEFFGDDANPTEDELEQLTRPGTAVAVKG